MSSVSTTIHVWHDKPHEAFSVKRAQKHGVLYWLRVGGIGDATVICTIQQLEHLNTTLDALLQDLSRDDRRPPAAIESFVGDEEAIDAFENDPGNVGLNTEL